MNAIIELKTEVLVDRSRIAEPRLRLLLAAVGEPLIYGSPWLVVNKQVARVYALLKNLKLTGAAKTTTA